MTGRSIAAAGAAFALLVALLAPTAAADDDLATLRGFAIAEEASPPPLGDPTNRDLRQARNYPEQPPTIPHKIRDYQTDLNTNRCLTCHSRRATEESQAPMISVTHFVGRDGQMRAFMSARRYFCTQCHVPQHEGRTPVENTFVDVDDLVDRLRQDGGG